MTRLIDIDPRRDVGTSRRALTGRVALGGERSAAFASSLERDWIELLDFLPDVSALQVQPFTLEYTLDSVLRRYTPDVAAVWERDGTTRTVIYEVKYAEELRAKWHEFRPRFVAATRYCRARDWRFKIVTEKHIRTPVLQAAKFLRRYRDVSTDTAVQQHLLATLRTIGPTTVGALLAAAYWSKDNQAMALPFLWKLIGEFQIVARLDGPLTMTTPIRPEG